MLRSSKPFAVLVMFSMLLTATTAVKAEWGLNLPTPVTPIGEEILNLHNLIMLICAVIFVGVFSVMFYSLYAHRKSKGHEASQFSHSTKAEIIWSVIPALILVGMAIPSTATLIHMEDTTEADLTVKITGYQWKWRYDYLDSGFHFYSNLSTDRAQILNEAEKGPNYLLEVDRELVLPVGKKVRFLVTANDVIHAWWVPKLAVKKDAIPGFINEIWTRIDEPGTYRGQCAELCGKDHGFMPIVVRAVPPEEYDAWVAEKQAAMEQAAADGARAWGRNELIAKGKEVHGTCAVCHGADGKGIPNVFPPIAGSDVAQGPVEQHLEVVMNGRQGTPMQAFKHQLNDVELAAVITYQRNSFGNATGDLIQPADVSVLR